MVYCGGAATRLATCTPSCCVSMVTRLQSTFQSRCELFYGYSYLLRIGFYSVVIYVLVSVRTFFSVACVVFPVSYEFVATKWIDASAVDLLDRDLYVKENVRTNT